MTNTPTIDHILSKHLGFTAKPVKLPKDWLNWDDTKRRDWQHTWALTYIKRYWQEHQNFSDKILDEMNAGFDYDPDDPQPLAIKPPYLEQITEA